jgi:hypothetical protein
MAELYNYSDTFHPVTFDGEALGKFERTFCSCVSCEVRRA